MASATRLQRHVAEDACAASATRLRLLENGLILIIAGILGLVLSLFYMLAWAPRRGQVVRDRVIERDP
jgi:hypothetical protein